MSGNFNLADYATVDERIDKYWQSHPKPEGSIQTEIIWVSNDGLSVAIKATVYQGDRILATGIAQEERLTGLDKYGKPAKGANTSSWWENCETSAIGRALANMGMSLSKRASREEMQKVQRYEDDGTASAGFEEGQRIVDAPQTARAQRAAASAPTSAPARPAPPTNGAGTPNSPDLDWNAFWRWAKGQNWASKHDMAVALGKPDDVINGWTPAQLRTAIEVYGKED